MIKAGQLGTTPLTQLLVLGQGFVPQTHYLVKRKKVGEVAPRPRTPTRLELILVSIA